MTRPPIVGAALWSAVMRKAGDRCECKGACGKRHDPDRRGRQQRCENANGQFDAEEYRASPASKKQADVGAA